MASKNTLLIISKYPNEINKKDGMVQRIAAMDEALSCFSRVYLDISIRKNLKRKTEQNSDATIHHVNFIIHFILICSLLIKAELIYVHSIYNALKIIPFYFFKKIITDMHGIVPEELKYEGKNAWSLIFSLAESITVKRSFCIITVTNKMLSHFQKKYNRKSGNDITIPIVNYSIMSAIASHTCFESNRPNVVIYSGGLQKWQNVYQMLHAVKKQASVHYIFLTAQINELREIANLEGISSIEMATVKPGDLHAYYNQSSFGFMLREDITLNHVACPTKAAEYMAYGIIPIVLCEDIGDFNDLGYRYVRLNDFLHSKFPTESESLSMRNENIAVVKNLVEQMNSGILKLRSLIS